MARERMTSTLLVVLACVLVGGYLFHTRGNNVTLTSLQRQIEPLPYRLDVRGYEKPLTASVACPSNLSLPKNVHYWSQSREDHALLQRYYSKPLKCMGTYLEIGALDGITYSNTLFFETYLGWSGVLIEAQPGNAKNMHKNRPKSRTFGMAVCDEGTETLRFAGGGAVGSVASEMTKKHFKEYIHQNVTVEIPCRPLSWILKKANVKAIDFFSLDVEGSEYFVLKTMDWLVPVGVFVVEVHNGDEEGSKRDAMVIKLLTDHGYRKADWNIRSYCVPGRDCTGNVVYENPNFPNLPIK